MDGHKIWSVYQAFKEGEMGMEEHMELLLKRLPALNLNAAITPGTYWFISKTINDGDGNLTRGKGKLRVEEDLTVEGEIYYGAGTNYNPDTDGKWRGKVVSGGAIQFTETIPTHSGNFIYSGKIETPTGELTGTYYWDIKPLATGTFTIQLFNCEPEDLGGIGIRPMELSGIGGYEQEIAKTKFCWRWFSREYNGDSYRVVTLEDAPKTNACTTVPHIRPRDFQGKFGYYSDLKYSFFCWRWFKINGYDYRVLTIEDPPYLSDHEGSSSITPKELAGVNGYSDEAGNFLFCWRWFSKGGVNYRVVTLE